MYFVALDNKSIDLSSASTDLFQPQNNIGFAKSLSRLRVVLTRQMQGARVICSVVQPNLEQYYNRTVEQYLVNAMCKYNV